MSDAINISVYLDSIKTIHCQLIKGKKILAKPLLLISIIELIEQNVVHDNKIPISVLQEQYNKLMLKYNVSTPFQYPTYFLTKDGFYHLLWRGQEIHTKAPSAKMLKENVFYAFLDNVLWDILQDKETRDMFHNTIENYFMK